MSEEAGKYTSGPWAIEDAGSLGYFVVADGLEHAMALVSGDVDQADAANARLIAAAPALYEALLAVEQVRDDHGCPYCMGYRGQHHEACLIGDALALVRGEEEAK